MKLIVNKSDNKFRIECQQLKLEVEKKINLLYNTSINQLIDLSKEHQTLPDSHINNTIVEVVPLLWVICKHSDPNATTFEISENSIFAAIAVCKHAVINIQLTKQEKNLSILAAIVVHTMRKQNIHVICNSNDEVQTLYADINNILHLIGIKSTITTQNDNKQELENTYTTEVIFGSYLDFMNNSLYLENIQTKQILSRDVAILTDVHTLVNTNLYCLYTELYGVKRLRGIISPMMLGQRYKTVLGFGTCDHIGKYLFSHSFGLQRVNLFDYSQTKTQIKYFKGTFISYNTISNMTFNYNFELEKFCNRYDDLIDMCVNATNDSRIAPKLETFRSNLAEYFVHNADCTTKMVNININNEVIPIILYPSDTHSKELFTEIVVNSILNLSTTIAWNELAQAFCLLNDYFVAVLMGKKKEVQKPNITQQLMLFGKTRDKAKSYTINALANSQFEI